MAARARPVEPNPLARLGRAIWRLLTSVNFAVIQIIILSLLAVIGMTIRQLPVFAFRSASDYITAIAEIHDRYDPVLGVGSSCTPSSGSRSSTSSRRAGSRSRSSSSRPRSSCCTLDRTPRLWRQTTDIRVVQPDPFFTPSLPDRAVMSGVPADAVRASLRRHRFKVREEEIDGARYLYGDRNQYTKLATLLTHPG